MKTINYGIDLGTSNSCIAYAQEGKVEIFKDNDGKDFIPSAVMNRGGRIWVGTDAYGNVARRPNNVVVRFKRAMGTNQTYTLEGVCKPLRPEDLSAEVLKELKRLASLRGHNVEHAVICTPATFDAAQVDATNVAARLAGISDPVLLSEPMAASYGYGLTSEKQGSWLVYDLGAGTFDAVVVQVRDGKMTILNIDGAKRCGGLDMDRTIWEELVIPEIARQAGIPQSHPVFKEFNIGGTFVTERAKIALSSDPKTEIDTSEIHHEKASLSINGEDLEFIVPLTRSAIESKVEPLIDETLEVCRRTLASFKQVCELLLIGGPTKMPIVRQKLKALGLPINPKPDPMTAVATGAAYYASTTPIAQPKPVAIPFDSGKSGTGKVLLQLDHEPSCEDTEAPLVVRCSDSRAGYAVIESNSRNWTSGRVPLCEGGHILMLPLASRKINVFSVEVYGQTGSLLQCEPNEISIFQTQLLAAAPPLPESLWVEIQDPDDEQKVIPKEVIKKGTPLPAKGTVTVKTTVELARGNGREVTIKIWEGNRKHLRANRYAMMLNLTGDSISRKLPANSKIEISLHVDASRRIQAEAYIPIADESVKIPKRDDRMDTKNPFQLEQRRKWLTYQIEQLEEENDNQDVKVSLELSRRQIFNEEVTKALRLAKEQGTDSADAFARVDEALRDAEDRLVTLREKEQETIVPNEWHHVRQRTKALIESELGTATDREHFQSISEAGESALERKRLNALRLSTQDMDWLRIRILCRQESFWRHLANDLPTDTRAYTNPDEAQRILERMSQPQNLDELKRGVVRLIQLSPTGTIGGDAEKATNITLG